MRNFDPIAIVKPLNDTQLMALIKAAIDEIYRIVPDDCHMDDAYADLEVAVAEFDEARKAAFDEEYDRANPQSFADQVRDDYRWMTRP
jgi:hypothetical protein